VQANLLAATATSPEARNQVYNVAVGDRTTLNQLFFALRDSLAQIVTQTEAQASIANAQPIYREFREGDVRHSQADISKAKTQLAYTPEYDISTGIQSAMPWHLSRRTQLA
jgi:UDP-N-acetylglucosamine 4-epimerase